MVHLTLIQYAYLWLPYLVIISLLANCLFREGGLLTAVIKGKIASRIGDIGQLGMTTQSETKYYILRPR